MLGVQNTCPVTNSVKFKATPSEESNRRQYSQYFDSDVSDDYVTLDSKPMSSEEEINAERDAKMNDVNSTKASFDDLAKNLEKNPGKVSSGASKLVRGVSSLIGLAGTFVMAKYGSKITLNTFRNVAKSNTIKGLIKNGKVALAPLGNLFKKGKEMVKGFKSNPLVQTLKNSKLGNWVSEFSKKPSIKNVIDKTKGYAEATKTLLKKIDKDKAQSLLENTMAVSTTTSVLIDDLAGRNEKKTNLDLALGASGGDK